MNFVLFGIVFVAFATLYSYIGWRVSKNIQSKKDYFLAGNNLGILLVTFSLIATQVGSGCLIGTPQKAYEIGLYGIFYIAGMSLGFILLAGGFAGKLQALNVSTTAEVFETKYNSIFLKKIASILSIVTLCGILIGQAIALKSVLASIGIENPLFFILAWLLIIGYTVLGGLRAVVVTDLYQVLFIICIFGGLAVWIVYKEPIGFIGEIFSAHKDLLFESKAMSYSSVLIFPAMFSLIEQDLAQRFFASKNRRTAVLSALYAAVFMMIFSFIPLYFGIKAKLSGIVVSQGENPLVLFLQNNVGEVVLVLAVFGLMAALTSTADSLLCAISSNIAQDFEFSFFKKINELKLSKIITFVVGIGALSLSYVMSNDIIDIIVSSYEVMVCCLFVPIIFALFKKRLKRNSAIASVLSGAGTFIFAKTIGFGFANEFVPLFVSLAAYLLGEYFFED